MSILTWADMIWGKPFYFFHPKFTLLCMSILTLEQILIWVLVLVLVLDMKVLDVLKYFLKKWVLDQYLYWVYIWGTWCTWVLGQLYLTPTLVYIYINSWMPLREFHMMSYLRGCFCLNHCEYRNRLMGLTSLFRYSLVSSSVLYRV